MIRRILPLVVLILLDACNPRPPQPAPSPHYVLEQAWHSPAGFWFYPRESFSYEATGLATVYGPGHAPLTTDGEAFDQSALAAAHQTLQLPAVARVTNLQNGRQILVRVNDRGPDTPHRLIALTEHAGALLGISRGDATEVRVQVESEPSQALAQALQPKGGGLDVQAAPRAAVQEQTLPPPPGVAQSPRGAAATAAPSLGETPPSASVALPPLRLPETVQQGSPQPGQLYIAGNEFSTPGYAEQERRAMGSAAQVVPTGSGKRQTYRVEAGPFPDVAAADAALDRALRAGVTDARIVVE